VGTTNALVACEATMTTKTNKTTMTPKHRARATTHARMPKTAAKETTDFAQYLIPGAAILGSGLLTTAGVIMRKHLAEVLGGAARATLSQGAHAMAQLDPEMLLAHVGLQRKRSSVVGIGMGTVAGLLVGSGLMLWLAPAIKRAMKPAAEVPSRADAVVRQEPAMASTNHHAT
jgi:hypothetical protein